MNPPFKSEERRARYFINRGFQLRYMGVFVAAGLMASVIIGGVLYYLVEIQTVLQLERGLQHFQDASFLIDTERNIVFAIFGTCALILSGLLSIWSLFLSHRVAGPVYALARRMNQIVFQYDLHTPLHLRKKDSLLEVKDFMNEVLSNLEAEFYQEKIIYDQIYEKLEQNRVHYTQFDSNFKPMFRCLDLLKKEKEKWLQAEKA